MANARKIAVNALIEVSKNGSYSNITLNKILATDGLSETDKAFATALFYGVLDRRITLDYFISRHIKTSIDKVSPTALECLRIALYQILYMDKIPTSAAVDESVKIIKHSKEKYLSGFVNGVLRNALRSGFELPKSNDVYSLSIKYSCPEWIVKSFINDYDIDNAVKLLEQSLCVPPVTVRVNTLKTDTDKLAEILLQEGVKTEKTTIKNSLRIVGGIDISHCKSYSEGMFHIQDISSQTAISVLMPSPGERVLDLCAAPGGKTFTMAEYMENSGEIIACDIYEQRLKLIDSGADRLKIDIIDTKLNDASAINNELGTFDAILCDVPCSGLGVIRRKPEIKYKNYDAYFDITLIQHKILENAATYLKVGGRILYSTCTLRKCENEGIINTFLDKHTDYELKYQRTFMPHSDGTDGFYCALLQKSR